MGKFEEQENTIARNPVTPQRLKAAAAFIEKNLYVTTALSALADVCQNELDDLVGARLLRSFAAEYLEHEASTL